MVLFPPPAPTKQLPLYASPSQGLLKKKKKKAKLEFFNLIISSLYSFEVWGEKHSS